jgi:hypothetical protein
MENITENFTVPRDGHQIIADNITFQDMAEPDSVENARWLIINYYKNEVMPHFNHPDKEHANLFYTWLFAAMPHRIEGWNLHQWRAIFRQRPYAA